MSTPTPNPPPTLARRGIAEAALAFRGYNVTNLGRTPELLAVAAYRPDPRSTSCSGTATSAPTSSRPGRLAAAVEERREFGLDQYAQAVALVVAIEEAQLRLLREHPRRRLPARRAWPSATAWAR